MLPRSLIVSALTAAALTVTAGVAAPAPDAAEGGFAALRPCLASQLKAAVASSDRATMHRELIITLTNVGANACAIAGYPAVRLLDAAGRPRIVRETFSRTSRRFVLPPGRQAAFGLRAATGDGTRVYRTVRTLAITPPGDMRPLLLSVEVPVPPSIDVTAVLPARELR